MVCEKNFRVFSYSVSWAWRRWENGKMLAEKGAICFAFYYDVRRVYKYFTGGGDGWMEETNVSKKDANRLTGDKIKSKRR